MKKILAKVSTSKKLKKIESFLRENKNTVLALVTISIFVDIFFVKVSSDIVIFGTLLLYGIFIKMFQINSRRTFLLCLALLAVMFIDFLFTGTSVSTEKAAVWLVLFMALGIFQQWRENPTR
ncbi:MAG: hypothetical protein A3H17_03350 [Candidatus Levybacteria bacterium RIFCSPLOWO2_12_FULL_37_14]|nr:MAG: hypothetical protein A3H17_03350 [Candidatus Levybacteria bacterium RIFCSPLOWO2_12_FULL_37_14]